MKLENIDSIYEFRDINNFLIANKRWFEFASLLKWSLMLSGKGQGGLGLLQALKHELVLKELPRILLMLCISNPLWKRTLAGCLKRNLGNIMPKVAYVAVSSSIMESSSLFQARPRLSYHFTAPSHPQADLQLTTAGQIHLNRHFWRSPLYVEQETGSAPQKPTHQVYVLKMLIPAAGQPGHASVVITIG